MPTYQYACTNPECSHQFELVQSFTDPAADTCPVCGAQVRKRYGSVGVVFKGSGFYRTDSRADSKGSNGKSTRPDKPAAASGSGDSSSSGDSGTSTTTTESTKASPAGSGAGSKVAATA